MKQNYFLKFLIKLFILLLSLCFITYKIIYCQDIRQAMHHVLAFDILKLLILFFVLLLMPLNWGIEAVKWKLLVKKLQPLSFNNSLKAVFSGVTAALFTPNRVGELGGRVFMLKKENRIPGVFCTGVGSFSQLTVTIIAGLTSLSGFIFYVPAISAKLHINKGIPAITTALLALFILYAYFNFNKMYHWGNRFNLLLKIKKYSNVLALYAREDMTAILALSFSRYVVFSFQFYLLLCIFGVNMGLFAGLGSIALTYLFTSFIPCISLAEFGTRGSSAIIFINFFSSEILGIISASVTLWVINLVIPALIGSIIFYKSKI